MVKIPYVKIQDEFGGDVASTLQNQGLFITTFKYTTKDDGEDECTIKLEAKDYSGVSAAGIFVYDLPLIVSWGYLGELGDPIIVYIRDMNTYYGNDSFYIELTCTDLASYLKSFKTQGTGNISVMEYLKIFVEDKYRTFIKYNGKFIWQTVPQSMKFYPGISKINNQNALPKPLIYKQDGNAWSKLDKEQILRGPEPEPFIDNTDTKTALGIFLNTPMDIVSANTSPMQVLKNIFRQAPDGPWFISGGGNDILIHNRDRGQAPIIGYSFMGENGFFSFTVETNREEADSSTLAYTTIDPMNKVTSSRESYIKSLKGLKPLTSIINDVSITQQEKAEYIKNTLTAYYGYRRYGVIKGAKYYRPIENALLPPTYEADQGRRGNLAIDKDATPDQALHAIMNNMLVAGYIYSAPLDTPEAEYDTINNIAKEIQMGKVKGTLKVPGNVNLTKDRVINLNGMLSSHNGEWYITGTDHVIDSNGYTTNCDMIIVDDTDQQGLLKNETTIAEDEDQENLEETYKTEQMLFRDLGKIKVLGTKNIGISPTMGIQYTEVGTEEKVLDMLQYSIDPNQDIEKLIEQINNGQYIIEDE